MNQLWTCGQHLWKVRGRERHDQDVVFILFRIDHPDTLFAVLRGDKMIPVEPSRSPVTQLTLVEDEADGANPSTEPAHAL